MFYEIRNWKGLGSETLKKNFVIKKGFRRNFF